MKHLGTRDSPQERTTNQASSIEAKKSGSKKDIIRFEHLIHI